VAVQMGEAQVVARLDDSALSRIEREHADGLSSPELLSFLEEHGVKFSEATLHKYVQLGLLPRSVRVGRKGKHRGSQGMYPASVIRQIVRIKDMMADDLTIEEIQREFLFVRGDIEELERVLSRIFENLGDVVEHKEIDGSEGRGVTRDIAAARAFANDLLQKLTAIEKRLTARARLARSAAG
jgi:hypothetical protein